MTVVVSADILFLMIRKPIVEGRFYPAQKEEITSLIEALKPPQTSKCFAQAAIVPHAGYPFSGKTAIATIAKVTKPQNVVMLGPNHTGLGKPFALSPAKSWQTPYGNVFINKTLSEKILDAGSFIELDSTAHSQEHSLEVELPILQYFFDKFTIVPICCAQANLETYNLVAGQIFKGIKNEIKNTLILASTDLTHYEPEEEARRKDRQAIEAIIELDAEKFIRRVENQKISTCGIAPVAILLLCLAGKIKKGEVILYQTSADTTGDSSSVVGYTGIIFR